MRVRKCDKCVPTSNFWKAAQKHCLWIMCSAVEALTLYSIECIFTGWHGMPLALRATLWNASLEGTLKSHLVVIAFNWFIRLTAGRWAIVSRSCDVSYLSSFSLQIAWLFSPWACHSWDEPWFTSRKWFSKLLNRSVSRLSTGSHCSNSYWRAFAHVTRTVNWASRLSSLTSSYISWGHDMDKI